MKILCDGIAPPFNLKVCDDCPRMINAIVSAEVMARLGENKIDYRCPIRMKVQKYEDDWLEGNGSFHSLSDIAMKLWLEKKDEQT